MSKKEELSRLQARKVALLTTMQKSDAHAAKCAKLGMEFAQEYPDDYAEYVAANKEYQEVERQINNLEFEISLEEDTIGEVTTEEQVETAEGENTESADTDNPEASEEE